MSLSTFVHAYRNDFDSFFFNKFFDSRVSTPLHIDPNVNRFAVVIPKTMFSQFFSLLKDEFFAELLPQISATCSEIVLRVDGSWTEVQDADDSDSDDPKKARLDT